MDKGRTRGGLPCGAVIRGLWGLWGAGNGCGRGVRRGARAGGQGGAGRGEGRERRCAEVSVRLCRSLLQEPTGELNRPRMMRILGSLLLAAGASAAPVVNSPATMVVGKMQELNLQQVRLLSTLHPHLSPAPPAPQAPLRPAADPDAPTTRLRFRSAARGPLRLAGRRWLWHPHRPRND